jgi:hypothetical protein
MNHVGLGASMLIDAAEALRALAEADTAHLPAAAASR